MAADGVVSTDGRDVVRGDVHDLLTLREWFSEKLMGAGDGGCTSVLAITKEEDERGRNCATSDLTMRQLLRGTSA